MADEASKKRKERDTSLELSEEESKRQFTLEDVKNENVPSSNNYEASLENLAEALKDLDDDNGMPVGFNFQPKDHEVISLYLAERILGEAVPEYDIPDIKASEFYYRHPEEIVEDRVQWFFIKQDDDNFRNKQVRVLSDASGYWQMDDLQFQIFDYNIKDFVGFKNSLRLFRKRDHGKFKKTHWRLEEYNLRPQQGYVTENMEWVIIKVIRGHEWKRGNKAHEIGGFMRGEHHESSEVTKRCSCFCSNEIATTSV